MAAECATKSGYTKVRNRLMAEVLLNGGANRGEVVVNLKLQVKTSMKLNLSSSNYFHSSTGLMPRSSLSKGLTCHLCGPRWST